MKAGGFGSVRGRRRPGPTLLLKGALLILLLAMVLPPGAEAAHPRDREEVVLLSSSPDGVEVMVSIPLPTVLPSLDHPGYHTISMGKIPTSGEPGEPALPRVGFWVAVPPGAAVAVRAEGEDDLYWDHVRPLPVARPAWIEGQDGGVPSYTETIAESPDVYSGPRFPSDLALAGCESELRYLRVIPVIVSPVRWDPSSGVLTVSRTVRVHVRFQSGAKREAGTAVLRDDPSWERMYNSVVLNHDQARGWARSIARRNVQSRAAQTTDRIKLEVRNTGVKQVTFSDLTAHQWAGTGASLADLRLFERFDDTDDAGPPTEVEVLVHILDADSSGTWTDGDLFYFYGQNLYDRLPDWPWYIKRYGRTQVYWLGLRPGAPNRRMEPAPSWMEGDVGVVASYPWTEHFEKEIDKERFDPTQDSKYGGVYGKMGAGSGQQPSLLDDPFNIVDGVRSVRTKHNYWIGEDPFDPGPPPSNWYDVPFDLPGFLSPLAFRARFQGLRRPERSSTHMISLYLARTESQTDTVAFPRSPIRFSAKDSALYRAAGADLEGMPLRAAGNDFVFLEDASGSAAALHWIEVAYMREPRFVKGRLSIATGAGQGPSEFRVAAAPSPDLIVGFEVTDPRAPKVLAIDPARQIEGAGAARVLKLRWNLTGDDRRFWIARNDPSDPENAGNVDPPEAIVPDTPSDLAALGDHDYVVVAPREWIPTLQPLIDHREAQGHRVLLAPIADIYDEFSGGRRWPHAIRTFLRTLFSTRAPNPGPAFLLLVGDATEAFDNGMGISEPNWVPTQTMFQLSYTSQGPELVSSDQWFVDNLNGTGEKLDFLPDMHFGRLPVGSITELQNVIAKILAYEEFQPGDSWRNRVLFVSDDAWSSTITFNESYNYKPNLEGIFRLSALLSMDVIRDFGQLPDFGIDSFFVATYMDTAAATGRCRERDPQTGGCRLFNPSAEWTDNLNYGTQYVAPVLWAAMSRGHLFVSYNGHANARLMTHEYVFRHNRGISRLDVEKLGNVGRPFVFMGYGCHLAEFSPPDERMFSRGDGISENMLFLYPDRGAVAAIASTGYEWLDLTETYNLAVVEAFFKNPPQVDGRTRWVLGEVYSQSKMNIMNDVGHTNPRGDNYQSMSATYTLLGDPGLVMDSSPPRMAVFLDDSPITDGTPLILPAGKDSLALTAHVRDEVWARSFAIRDLQGLVPPERYEVIPDSSRVADTTFVEDRGFTVLYRTTIFPQNYDIVLSAEDRNGRSSQATFPVRVTVALEWLRPGREWRVLSPGTLVLEGDSLRAVVDLPRYLAVEELRFLVDGRPGIVHARAGDPVDGRSRHWTLTLLDDILNGHQRALSIGVAQPQGGTKVYPETPLPIETSLGSQRYAIEDLYNVPNPFPDETWIFYSLRAPADDVMIRIYTSSGKLIRTLQHLPAPQLIDDPPVLWDGHDEDGDPVANGLYFYKLTVRGPQGELNRIEKMARVR